MTNIEYAAGLRQLADFYETHPEMPQPCNPGVWFYTKQPFVDAIRILADGGMVVKTTDPGSARDTLNYHRASRTFGELKLELLISKSLVCRKVQEEVWECPDSLLEPEAINA